ncbi:DUF4144 family protein [Enterovibrio coralii]|uniref:Uncharacterized protein n=1 Tax=Enterovibrio coralii TaxID=294935 RepID=A0A135I931_9GAMM|nr:DUF4144 family protein [Enterovibrio coralii]KXF81927.1 hypothetical protein ATN88_18340 [Enterovibrio coralii]
MIQWPCIFKLEGDDELMYLASQSQLEAEFEALIWSDDDYLIDSQGRRFSVQRAKGGELAFEATSCVFTSDEVTLLIQAHEFSKAEVCLTKIHFLSVSDAIHSLSNQN